MKRVTTIKTDIDYFVCQDGFVYNHEKRKIGSKTSEGYIRVAIMSLSRKRYIYAHRLIAQEFKGTPPKGMQCRHLNGIRTDNRPSNLAWGTAKENQHDRYEHNTHQIGEKNASAKITKADASWIVLNYGFFETRVLAKKFKCTPQNISRIATGKSWHNSELKIYYERNKSIAAKKLKATRTKKWRAKC